MTKQMGLQLAFLGRPEIQVGGELLAKGLPVKGVALLAYLAVTNRPCSRESLAGLLWGDMPDEAARVNLRVTLNRLSSRLRPFLHLDHQTIALKDGCQLDVTTLETAAAAQDVTAWETAVSLYRSDFLDGLTVPDAPAFEEWVLLERERLRLLVIELLHRLADNALNRQVYAAGITYIRRSLALDNWREEAHRLLMRLLVLDSRRSDALAQFETCRRLLAENLGVEPAAETIALYEAIKHGRLTPSPQRPQVAHPFTPAPLHPRTPSPLPPHNLPAIAASFVGREAELAQLATLLAQPDGRLLTILGPGGVGKTRLALETAVRHLNAPYFPDGLFFVPLADLPPGMPTLSTSALLSVDYVEAPAPGKGAVAPIIAEAIGLKLSGSTPPDEQLRQHLRERRLLLVLDNFEHLLPQAGLLADLLAAAPGLRIIVTSRERLNLYEEWLVELSGLDLPPAATITDYGSRITDYGTTADWTTFSAPQLFIQRARRVFLGFDHAAERDAILYICRLVGGLPLALELAAAWVRTASCRDIARAIERHLDFLTSDWRNMPARQRSLRAAFDYSWSLLHEAEQDMLARLAVFRGGFDSAAALAIAGETGINCGDAEDAEFLPDEPPRSRRSLRLIPPNPGLRHLSALVDKSLVQRQPDGRYHLHETIRVFAQERAGEEGWAQVRADHTRYYAEFWAGQGGKIAGPDAEAAFRALALELENGRFAWQWALDGWPETEPVLAQSLPHLSLFYLRRGRSLEAIDWLAEALEHIETDGGAGSRLAAQMRHQLAKHEEALGRYAQSQARLLACLPALEAADLTAYAADAWEILGRTQRLLGDVSAAEASFRRSLELHRISSQPSSVAGILNSLGVLTKNSGRYVEAAAYYAESLDIFRQQGDQAGVAVCLINLGNIANVQGEYGRARANYQESYELAAAAQDRPNMAINLLNLGSVARASSDTAAAAQYYRDSLALGQEMGRGLIVAAALDGLGQTLLLAGDLAAARAALRDALAAAVSLQSPGMILTVLASAGQALALAGQTAGARLLQLVMNHAAAAHYVREEAAAFAGRQGINLAETETAVLTLDEAINLARTLLIDDLY